MLSRAYHRLYDALCGAHPAQRPWHFQWLAIRDLRRRLRQVLSGLSGSVLDIGCGEQPYRRWLPPTVHYVGLDLDGASGRAEIRVAPGEEWPLASESIDAALCTEVIEHVKHLDDFLSEIVRVLKPGGTLVLSVPFAYNQHDWPHDYRRFSIPGVALLLERDFEIVKIEGLGGVGSTVGMFVLNWVDMTLSGTPVRRTAKGLVLPLWIALGAGVNLLGWIFDRIDGTAAFYGRVFAVVRRTI